MTNSKKFGLTKKHWVGYMCGDWGGCMTFTLMSTIFSIFCTNALGIDPGLLGTLVIIWTIWDAINDPLMGALMDRAFAKKQNPRGKFRPWILRATPLLAITAIAMWTTPTFFEGIPLIVVLFSTKILYEAAYTMFNIPMGSLLSAMSENDVERASLSSARGAGSGFGNAIPGIVAPLIIAAFGERDARGYMIVGVAAFPCRDGELVTGNGVDILRADKHLKIPYLCGSTSEDFGSPMLHSLAKKWCAAQIIPSYTWLFDRRLPGDDRGAWHSSDLWYWFGTLGNSWRPMEEKDYSLSDRMTDYLTNFAKTGNPNGKGLPVWNPTNKGTLRLGEGETSMGKVSKMKLWQSMLTGKSSGE